MKIFIGIDDTDNLETRGTGFHARSLGLSLSEAGLFTLQTVTRHQLLADPRIPFTSHNSSACLYGETRAAMNEIIMHCRDFLVRESAPDSDAGLCIMSADKVPHEVIRWGHLAKKEILKLDDAVALAAKYGIFLEAFLNARIGMIGSLAAAGLRAEGNDGRLLWTRNLRETMGVFRVSEYLRITGIERVVQADGSAVNGNVFLHVTEWTRPVMKDGLITLIAEKTDTQDTYEYQSASKEYIKSISE